MSNPDTEVLGPDEAVTSSIFDGKRVQNLYILAQDPDVCTFMAQVGKDNKIVLVRLERRTDRLDRICCLEKLAMQQIPRLIRQTHEQGFVMDLEGRRVAYKVTRYLEDCVSLGSVWDTFDKRGKDIMVYKVACAIRQLHTLYFQDRNLKGFIESYTGEVLDEGGTIPMGNLELGFHHDFLSLLKSMIEQAGPDWCASVTEQADGSIILVSIYKKYSAIRFSPRDLKSLKDQLVLCHNDLEPHNIMFTESRDDYGNKMWTLRAIMDWEVAGIFPFAYEYAYKDAVLGGCNFDLDWYNIFKQKASSLLPMDISTDKFIEAVQLIYLSATRAKERESGSRVRKKWLADRCLGLTSDVRRGWVVLREGEDDVEEIEELEADEVEELSYVETCFTD